MFVLYETSVARSFRIFSIFKNGWTIISSWSRLEGIGFSFF
ncbi:hypothetical protein LEP1GSC186_1959 [Leptospira noguchii serovar Autumnalis str. ZUN142]|uniref:Uncharacterized protein n=3 Tax=Leptospira noguchii TaxID=28182 RepID=T0GKU4_9LEPT|nr:hypothetical protein LEP1GSC186_1959 [Leptospira noguchii serovar Autumnalis str. ZUN142]EMO53795.1 hypothetical protein LEP1GSC172_1278 [Leptospira noguchii]EQA69502.1 hypothetical protein LEP1GSC059_2165 [Leptospira noguchii serovar Panama str. CZ214]